MIDSPYMPTLPPQAQRATHIRASVHWSLKLMPASATLGMRETYSGPTVLDLVMATLCFPARVCMKPLVCPCILALPPKQASMPQAVLFLSFVLCSV